MVDVIIIMDYYSFLMFLFFLGVQSGPHERRLINDLLERYNNLERPVFNESEPLDLKFGLTLQQIIDVVSFLFTTAHVIIFLYLYLL